MLWKKTVTSLKNKMQLKIRKSVRYALHTICQVIYSYVATEDSDLCRGIFSYF